MYEFEVRESYVYNPESVKEGYRMLDEFLAQAYLREQKKQRENRRN